MLLRFKQIGTICFAILISIFSISSFADNITTSPADCTQPTLSVDTGTANLNAQWEANNIKIRWYNNNTLMESGDNTCTYDTSFATAGTSSTMTRTGYEFKGWRVRSEMDFGTIPTNTNGDERWGKGRRSNGKDYCYYKLGAGTAENVSCGISEFADLTQFEWKVRFGTSYVYGMSKCSETSGTANQPGTPSDTNGQYCWCKATGYKPSDSNTIYGPMSYLSWIFGTTYGSATDCANACATVCSSHVLNSASFRTALFTPAAQQ